MIGIYEFAFPALEGGENLASQIYLGVAKKRNEIYETNFAHIAFPAICVRLTWKELLPDTGPFS